MAQILPLRRRQTTPRPNHRRRHSRAAGGLTSLGGIILSGHPWVCRSSRGFSYAARLAYIEYLMDTG